MDRLELIELLQNETKNLIDESIISEYLKINNVSELNKLITKYLLANKVKEFINYLLDNYEVTLIYQYKNITNVLLVTIDNKQYVIELDNKNSNVKLYKEINLIKMFINNNINVEDSLDNKPCFVYHHNKNYDFRSMYLIEVYKKYGNRGKYYIEKDGTEYIIPTRKTLFSYMNQEDLFINLFNEINLLKEKLK